jgi:hypothetical protein
MSPPTDGLHAPQRIISKGFSHANEFHALFVVLKLKRGRQEGGLNTSDLDRAK